jgi:hypothetical protein
LIVSEVSRELACPSAGQYSLEDGSSKVIRNLNNYLAFDTASHPLKIEYLTILCVNPKSLKMFMFLLKIPD